MGGSVIDRVPSAQLRSLVPRSLLDSPLRSSEKMNKKELAIVLIRFAGLYFAYLAVKKISAVVYFAWVLSTILGDVGKDVEFAEKVSLSTALPGAVSFLVTAGVAYYLLRKGTWVIEFLSKD